MLDFHLSPSSPLAGWRASQHHLLFSTSLPNLIPLTYPRSNRSSATMGKTFAAVKLCHTDDFPSPQNDGIKRWVENNGGTCHRQIRSDTTHLVCSKKAWKRNSHPLRMFTFLTGWQSCHAHRNSVKEARRHNRELASKKVPRKKRIQIVKYDWLEDSLQSKTRKPKSTAPYDWEQKKLGRAPAPASPQPSITQTDEPKAAEKVARLDRKSKALRFELCLAD